MRSFAILLYRDILKEHRRKLPPQLRLLGDNFVRHEFKQHKSAKPEHLSKFYKGWTDYLAMMKKSESNIGKDMKIADLNEQQIGKLRELNEEVRKINTEKMNELNELEQEVKRIEK